MQMRQPANKLRHAPRQKNVLRRSGSRQCCLNPRYADEGDERMQESALFVQPVAMLP